MKKWPIIIDILPPKVSEGDMQISKLAEIDDEINDRPHTGAAGRILFWALCALFLLILFVLLIWLFASHLDFSMIGMIGADGGREIETAPTSVSDAPIAVVSAGPWQNASDGMKTNRSGMPYSKSPSTTARTSLPVSTSSPLYFSQGAPLSAGPLSATAAETVRDVQTAGDFTILSPDPPLTDCPDAQE